jgi:hypothetical protein
MVEDLRSGFVDPLIIVTCIVIENSTNVTSLPLVPSVLYAPNGVHGHCGQWPPTVGEYCETKSVLHSCGLNSILSTLGGMGTISSQA